MVNWSPIGSRADNNYVRDYRHAARIFRSNDFSRAPKSKFSFYVRILINPNAENVYGKVNVDRTASELNYLVKNVELPKFEIEVQDLNQYNRKVLIQKQIKYNPVTIKFHDDNIGNLRKFWAGYYSFYYNDSRYNDTDYKIDDKYLQTKSNRWGYDTGVKIPYIDKIEIYSMYHTDSTQLITLENPIISSFSHDSHDYSENTGIMEASMTFHYTGVIYAGEVEAKNGIPGFGQAAPEAYDTDPSSIAPGAQTFNLNQKTNNTYDTTTTDRTPQNLSGLSQMVYSPATMNTAYNSNPSSTPFLNNSQINSLGATAPNNPSSSGFSFPTPSSTTSPSLNYGSISNTNSDGTLSTSSGQAVYSPAQVGSLYTPNSWQDTLYNQGYTQDQINAASLYIAQANLGPSYNLTSVAQQYINNPSSVGNYNYGQASSVAVQINFANPVVSTQPVYNGLGWQNILQTKGYSDSEIALAQSYLNSINLSSAVAIATVAENYIINTKLQGISSITPSITVNPNILTTVIIDPTTGVPVAL